MLFARSRVFLARLSSAVVAVVFLAGCGGSHDRLVRVFTTTLSGLQQTPPNASLALGTGMVTIDMDTGVLTASVVVSGIADTAVYLQEAPPGLEGPVLLPLAKIPGSTVWTGGVVISDAQWHALRSGLLYFSVRSASFPAGEIRGHLIEQWPLPEQWARLQQARPQSTQLDQHLRLVEEAEDDSDWHFSGIGLGLTIGL